MTEEARIDSMRSHLHHGDVLFEIGAEKGTQSVIYAEIVGAENMCLFEGEPSVWPNIRQAFIDFPAPRSCYVGLVSDVTRDPPVDYDDRIIHGWPICALEPPTPFRTFRYIHEHASHTRQARLDDWVADTHIPPTALAIDVEGAELAVLKGSHSTLTAFRPFVWVSIHPDLMEKDYNCTRDDLLAYMDTLGYKAELLGEDHEQHWILLP